MDTHRHWGLLGVLIRKIFVRGGDPVTAPRLRQKTERCFSFFQYDSVHATVSIFDAMFFLDW